MAGAAPTPGPRLCSVSGVPLPPSQVSTGHLLCGRVLTRLAFPDPQGERPVSALWPTDLRGSWPLRVPASRQNHRSPSLTLVTPAPHPSDNLRNLVVLVRVSPTPAAFTSPSAQTPTAHLQVRSPHTSPQSLPPGGRPSATRRDHCNPCQALMQGDDPQASWAPHSPAIPVPLTQPAPLTPALRGLFSLSVDLSPFPALGRGLVNPFLRNLG